AVPPPIDDQYEFIHIAHSFWRAANDRTFLDEQIAGLPLRERLTRAFAVPATDEATGGMVFTTAPDRAVGFGFCDTVYLTGSLLFPSLLRYRAAKELARLEINPRANDIAVTMASHFGKVFADPSGSGWLLAATDVGRQPDIWGTLYALNLGVLAPDEARDARNAVIDALHNDTITLDGAVRHLPADQHWEKVAP